MSKANRTKRRKPGPSPETIKLDGPWEDRVSDSLKRKKPASGWPKAKLKRLSDDSK